MNYIGSKAQLVDSLIDRVMRHHGITPPGAFLDAFAGTHVVGQYMQKRGWSVRANDLMGYSSMIGTTVLHNKVLTYQDLVGEVFLNRVPFEDRLTKVIDHLNYAAERADFEYDPAKHGGQWFLDKYCEGGKDGRLYFSADNGKRICYLMHIVDQWRLTWTERVVLIFAIVEAADRVANTASVYYTYLKKLKNSAQRRLMLRVPRLGSGPDAMVYRMDAVEFVKMHSHSAKVLYMDPPYNQRQYAPNYHLLETIALWDDPEAKGVGGVRPYDDQKSGWCSRDGAARELANIMTASGAEWAMLSYSNEGLLSKDEIFDIMNRFGKTICVEYNHPRFKSQRGEAPKQVIEYLFVNKRD